MQAHHKRETSKKFPEATDDHKVSSLQLDRKVLFFSMVHNQNRRWKMHGTQLKSSTQT